MVIMDNVPLPSETHISEPSIMSKTLTFIDKQIKHKLGIQDKFLNVQSCLMTAREPSPYYSNISQL